MKKFLEPEVQLVYLRAEDILTASDDNDVGFEE